MHHRHESAEVIDFWFGQLSSKDRWTRASELDPLIIDRFGAMHAAAIAGELWRWRETPDGRLAEIVVLDQFSRHIYRNQPPAFAADPVALVLAQEAVRCGDDQLVATDRRLYVYLPYMHSESRVVHERALELFTALGDGLDFELKHKAIIDRFGRYPYRNEILGRPSTPAEIEFLDEPGSSFLE